MVERIFTRDDVALALTVSVSAEGNILEAMNMVFNSFGDVLLRRYTGAVLDAGPTLLLVQAAALRLSLPRIELLTVDEVLAIVHALEDDIAIVVQIIDRMNAEAENGK